MAGPKIDPLKVTERYVKRTSQLINDSNANGFDTYYTPQRVLYWFHPKTFEFLWSNPGIIANVVLGTLFTGLFVLKDHYSRQRRKQLTHYSFVATQLTQRFDDELNHDPCHASAYGNFSSFQIEFNAFPENAKELFKILLQAETNEQVLAIIEDNFFNEKREKPLTIKELLKWIPVYLHKTKGEVATIDLALELFEEEPEQRQIDIDDTTDDQASDELLPWYKRWLRNSKSLLSLGISFVGFVWNHINKYTMGYWITRAIATVFNKPQKLDGSLTANTLAIFLLPLVGVVVSTIHVGLKGIRWVRDKISPRDRSGYEQLESEEDAPKAYLAKLSKENTQLLHIKYFEKQLANLLTLKNELQQHELSNRLRKNLKYLNATQNTVYELSKMCKDNARKAIENHGLKAEQERVTAETIREDVLHNSWKSWKSIRSWLFGGVAAKTFAAGAGTAVSYFAMVSFIFWVAEEILGYCGVSFGNALNFSLFTGTWIDFVSLGIAIGVGVIAGVISAIQTYNTHQAMAQQLQQVPVKKALQELAERQNELNLLKAELIAAQGQELSAINAYNQKLLAQNRPANFLLKAENWKTKLPEFATFDALNYARFNETLSFKTSVKTYIKQGLNRALAALMGGITGTLVARLGLSTLKVLVAAGSIGALFANPATLPVAVVLTVLFLASTAFFAGIRLWNYHLNRIKTDQQNFITLLTPPADSKEPPLKERLDLQIKLCQQLKEQSIDKIALLDDAKARLEATVLSISPKAGKRALPVAGPFHADNPYLKFRSTRKIQPANGTELPPKCNLSPDRIIPKPEAIYA